MTRAMEENETNLDTWGLFEASPDKVERTPVS
jgi:hypothetical protein